MAEPTIKRLWGIAKSKELSLTDEELHIFISAHTGKDSIRKLTKRELGIVIGILQNMKDSASKDIRSGKRESGNVGTVKQRKKIYKLTQELGWERKARVNGLCKKMFGVSSVEWLDYGQCSKLIEALKNMVERKDNKNE
ncbi:MAG: regulatory protein GemA [Lachnospiraceae bacterium]|nr:regulatory protein GemA [Lachnospiraceae bacterium]MDE6251136.1 regulatory protein GemA [Lachnospiraceae bacterium]